MIREFTFNRTSMELKHTFETIVSRMLARAFNRTSMELKHIIRCFRQHYLSTFNRTSMELKQWRMAVPMRCSSTFNRTSMELKRRLHTDNRFHVNYLLIEPVWN